MRITLYDYAYETFAVQFLASNLKKHGFDTEVFYDCSMNKDYLGEDFFLTSFFSLSPEQAADGILNTNPDVVGFSVLTVYYPQLKKIIRRIKEIKPEITVLCGEPHATLAPTHLLKNPDIDFIFLGDADISLPSFLKELASNPRDELKTYPAEKMPGVANMRGEAVALRGLGPILKNLDEAPFPEKEAYYKKNPSLKILYTTICSRGCIYKCTYCNSSTLRKIYRENDQNYFRMRSVDNVIEELKEAKEKYRPWYVMFIDNLFAPKKEWLKEFADKYKREINLPYFCETNPNVHSDETLELLAYSGCKIVQFGFQSASEEVRREILHRPETNMRIRRIVKKAKELGIFVCIDHIANLPGEKKEHIDEALELYRELRPNWINLGFLQYYPKADIVEIAIAKKAIEKTAVPLIFRGERQTSFRLLSKSGLGDEYRTLPIRFFIISKLPLWMQKPALKMVEYPLFVKLYSPFASFFLYGTRIFYSFTDRRDFLVRHHIIRNLYVMRTILIEKFAGYGRHT
ncbi:MAG: radical SAM protein [Nitrospinota bacterium]